MSRAAAGDPPEYTYRTNVNEVRLTFAAMDQNNHGVATLQASDFAVVDKDIIVRTFQSFTRSDWTKLEIAIVVDGSESVTPRFRREMADVLELVSQTAGVPDENLSIFSFHASQPALLCARDCRATHAADTLPAGHAGGLTPLFDTIAFAADYLAHTETPTLRRSSSSFRTAKTRSAAPRWARSIDLSLEPRSRFSGST